jgi:hypothetical protein
VRSGLFRRELWRDDSRPGRNIPNSTLRRAVFLHVSAACGIMRPNCTTWCVQSSCVAPLPSLGGNKSLIILTRKRNDLNGVLKTAVQGVRESDGESGGQKIDINLKMPR